MARRTIFAAKSTLENGIRLLATKCLFSELCERRTKTRPAGRLYTVDLVM